jgi:hypothetical protein
MSPSLVGGARRPFNRTLLVRAREAMPHGDQEAPQRTLGSVLPRPLRTRARQAPPHPHRSRPVAHHRRRNSSTGAATSTPATVADRSRRSPPPGSSRPRRTSDPRPGPTTSRSCASTCSRPSPSKPIAAIGPAEVRRFLAERSKAGAAPGTVRSARKVLRLVLATAQADGAIRSNPCDGSRVAASPKAEMVFLTAEQVEALANTPSTSGTRRSSTSPPTPGCAPARSAPSASRARRPRQRSDHRRRVRDRGPRPRSPLQRTQDLRAALGHPSPPSSSTKLTTHLEGSTR